MSIASCTIYSLGFRVRVGVGLKFAMSTVRAEGGFSLEPTKFPHCVAIWAAVLPRPSRKLTGHPAAAKGQKSWHRKTTNQSLWVETHRGIFLSPHDHPPSLMQKYGYVRNRIRWICGREGQGGAMGRIVVAQFLRHIDKITMMLSNFYSNINVDTKS